MPDTSHTAAISAKNNQVDETLSIFTYLMSVLDSAANRITTATSA